MVVKLLHFLRVFEFFCSFDLFFLFCLVVCMLLFLFSV